MFCSYYFKNGWFRHFVFIFCATASLALFLNFFCQNQGFYAYKIVLIKKECIQNERLQLHLTDSKKNGATVKIHPACQKTITNEMKYK